MEESVSADISKGSSAITSGELIQADLEEGEDHIEGVMDDADIRVARIPFDDDGKCGDLVIVFSGEEKNFRVEGESAYSGFTEEMEGRGAAEQLESTLGVGEFEVSENENLE